MVGRPKAPQSEIDEARELRRQGLTIEQIADEMSRSTAWVHTAIDETRTYADRKKLERLKCIDGTGPARRST